MSDKIANTQDRPEEKPLTEQELQFCNLYVNGGLEYAGRPKKCFVEVFGEDTVKNPYASANYLMNKPLRAVSVNAAKALMDIFPIRHKEENRLRIEGSDGNVIFNVIVPQNPMTDGEKET